MLRLCAEAVGWAFSAYAVGSALAEGWGLAAMMIECAGSCSWGQ